MLPRPQPLISLAPVPFLGPLASPVPMLSSLAAPATPLPPCSPPPPRRPRYSSTSSTTSTACSPSCARARCCSWPLVSGGHGGAGPFLHLFPANHYLTCITALLALAVPPLSRAACWFLSSKSSCTHPVPQSLPANDAPPCCCPCPYPRRRGATRQDEPAAQPPLPRRPGHGGEGGGGGAHSAGVRGAGH